MTQKKEKILLDGKEFDVANLSKSGVEALARYKFVAEQLSNAKRHRALLAKAKIAYINDLKNEMIRAKTGVDFGSLFEDE